MGVEFRQEIKVERAILKNLTFCALNRLYCTYAVEELGMMKWTIAIFMLKEARLGQITYVIENCDITV